MRVRDICSTCEGDGYLPDWDDDDDSIDTTRGIMCEECDGTGFAEEGDGLKSDVGTLVQFGEEK